MPLNFTPKGKSNPTQPQPAAAPSPRPQVSYGKPTPSSARAEALKARLTNTPPGQPQAPRRAGSSARAEQFDALQKFTTQPAPPQTKPIGVSSARQDPKDFSNVAPPPSGIARGASNEAPNEAQTLSQTDTSTGTHAAPEAPSEPLSPQFVALAKQERANRKAQNELKLEKEAWKREREGFISKTELSSDPLKVLTEAGVSYDRLVELQLNQGTPDPNQELLQKIADLESKLAAVDEKFVTRDKQGYDAAVNQIRRDIQLLVDSDAAFETTKSEGASEDVVDLVKKVFDEEGIVLPVEEACQLIEEKLVDREYHRVERLTKLSKIKSRMAPPAEPPAEANPAAATAPKSQTLSNTNSVQRPLSARERAILAFNRAKATE